MLHSGEVLGTKDDWWARVLGLGKTSLGKGVIG